MPLFVAYARYREAEAYLAAGDSVAAATSLATARTIADDLGAAPLRAAIADLGRRGRLPIDTRIDTTLDAPAPTSPAAAADERPWGLSGRELEVLALVADGRTNRQIAEVLFITEKTASVHVTHILDKLGVSSRVEAALLAGRAGLAGTVNHRD